MGRDSLAPIDHSGARRERTQQGPPLMWMRWHYPREQAISPFDGTRRAFNAGNRQKGFRTKATRNPGVEIRLDRVVVCIQDVQPFAGSFRGQPVVCGCNALVFGVANKLDRTLRPRHELRRHGKAIVGRSIVKKDDLLG